MTSAATFTIRTSIPIWSTKSASIRSMSMPVRRGSGSCGRRVTPWRGSCGRSHSVRRIGAGTATVCGSLRTAQIAKNGGFDAFTTTLLYSRFQKHDLIRSIGEAVAGEYGIPFLYRDFREGWSEGVRISKSTWIVPAALLRLHLQRKGALLPHTAGVIEGEDRLNSVILSGTEVAPSGEARRRGVSLPTQLCEDYRQNGHSMSREEAS